MATLNRMATLAARPVGAIKTSDFKVVEASLPDPGPGELLARITHVSLDPAMRGWVSEGKSYVPPVQIGEVMRSFSVGVVERSNNPAFKPGDGIAGMIGAQSHVVTNGKGLSKVDLSGADLTGADLTDADLDGANLSGVKGLDTVKGLDKTRNLDKAIRTTP